MSLSKAISVVIPCYNWEKYLKRCIDSLINQTYKNIEIICINDWSTDNSLELLNSFSEQDKRIKVFSQKNQGAWIARNTWIKNSKWDFITFVDCDDVLELDAIENLVEYLDNDTDIIISGIKILHWKNIVNRIVPNEKNWLRNQFRFTATVFKLYKRKLLIDNDIYFKSYKIHEDVLFAISAFSSTNNIKILSKDDYVNYQYSNPNSLTANLKNMVLNGDTLNSLLQDLIKVINPTKYSKKMVKFFLLKTLIQDIIVYKSPSNVNNIYLFNYNFIQKEYWNIRFYRQHWESFKVNLIINLFIFFTKFRISAVLIFLINIFIK